MFRVPRREVTKSTLRQNLDPRIQSALNPKQEALNLPGSHEYMMQALHCQVFMDNPKT